MKKMDFKQLVEEAEAAFQMPSTFDNKINTLKGIGYAILALSQAVYAVGESHFGEQYRQNIDKQ